MKSQYSSVSNLYPPTRRPCRFATACAHLDGATMICSTSAFPPTDAPIKAASKAYLQALISLSKERPPDSLAFVLWHPEALMHKSEDVLSALHQTLCALMPVVRGERQATHVVWQLIPDMVFVTVFDGIQSAIEVHEECVYGV